MADQGFTISHSFQGLSGTDMVSPNVFQSSKSILAKTMAETSSPEEQDDDEEDAIGHWSVVEVFRRDWEFGGHDCYGADEQQVHARHEVEGAAEGSQVDGAPHELIAGSGCLECKGNQV